MWRWQRCIGRAFAKLCVCFAVFIFRNQHDILAWARYSVVSLASRMLFRARGPSADRGRGSTICYAQGLRLASPWPMVPGPNYIYKPRPMAASTLHHSSPRRKGQNEKKRKNMAAGCCNEYLKTTESYAETTDFRLHSAPRPPPFSSSSTRRPGHSGLGPRFLAPRSATLTPGHRGL